MTVQEWLGKDNQLGIDIWERKYRQNNESFDEWLNRVSGGSATVQKLIKEKKFLFGGRILSNRGLDKKGEKCSYSNCYVIAPPEDNIESIFDCAKKLARTFSYGGGCGIDISKLAPRGAKVHNTAKETSGAVSFMDLYSMITGLIGQNGRRGALMISIDCTHPDLDEFIEIKSDLDRVTKANISIRITDEFMEAVRGKRPWKLNYTRKETGETIEKTVDAYELFHKICEMNWDYAEPGMLFWDRIENWNLLSEDDNFHYAGVNPCAEEPLPAGGSCLLGSINLSEFVTEDKQFDYENFKETVRIAVSALNDVLDEGMPLHPLQEQRESVKEWRQIGLGIMGLADMLIKMDIIYGSKESIDLCNDIGWTMADVAINRSAMESGCKGSYPAYDLSWIETAPYYWQNASTATQSEVRSCGLRNSQLLTIAPTGTLSTMLGISGGIEPIYATSYTRKTESLHGHDEYYKVYTPIVKEYMEAHGITDEKDLPEYFVTAQNLDYHKRIDMQAAWQRHIDASISSTINLPQEATVEQVEDLYMYAWEQGLKGVTIFRDGCKRTGILSTNETKEKIQDESTVSQELPRGVIIKADDNCIGRKRTLITGCGTLHCEAFFDPDTGNLLETYFSKGSSGGCVDADTEYFNGYMWKRISDYQRGSQEKVLQYREDGFAELVEPLQYIVNHDISTLKQFKNLTGLDMVLSEDHRMYLYKNYSKYKKGIRSKLTTEIVTVKDYLQRSKSKERHVPTVFKYQGKGIPLTDDQIRLLVAIYADGTYSGNQIRVALKKERKKIRFRELLKNCNVGWSERKIYRSEYIDFYLYPIPSIKEWFSDKQFTPKWYECTDHQLEVIISECVFWDGSTGDNNRLGAYYSSKKEEVDFIQFALTRSGFRATISKNNSSMGKESYRVRWTRKTVHNLATSTIVDYPTKDGCSYCFTVPSGLLVLRRNGHIFITGNCNNFMIGLSRMISLAARGGVDIYSIVDQLTSSGTCPSYAVRRATKHDTSTGSSCPVAIGNALIDMYKEIMEDIDGDEDIPNTVSVNVTPQTKGSGDTTAPKCPECGGELVFEGGCNTCKNCGYSKCD